MTAPSGFLLCEIEAPAHGLAVIPGGALHGHGFAFGDHAIDRIAVHLGTEPLGFASYGLARSELARAYPAFAQAGHAGFAFALRWPADPTPLRGADLIFHFHTEDGKCHARHLRLRWDGAAENDAPAHLAPIRLVVEECRVDSSQRLVVGGTVLTRQKLDWLRLYHGATMLAAPRTQLRRPELASDAPSYPGADRAGFRLVQRLPEAVADGDTVRVVARAGSAQRQVIVPIADAADPGPARLLRRGTVTVCVESLHQADGRLTIEGWAVGRTEIRDIALSAGPRAIASAELGLGRPDIGNRFPDLPAARHAGFYLQAPLPAGKGALGLTVRDATGSEQRLRLPRPGRTGPDRWPDAPPLLGLDQPGENGAEISGPLILSGWAIDPHDADGIAVVEIHADGHRLGEARRGIRREDVAARFPDLPQARMSGFAFVAPPGVLSDGTHDVMVLAITRREAVAERGVRVRVEPDDDPDLDQPRQSVPVAATALCRAVLAALGCQPRFTILIGALTGSDPEKLRTTLGSLRHQTLPDWRVVLLCPTQGAHQLAAQAVANLPALPRPILALAPPFGPIPWPDAPDAATDWLMLLHAGDRLEADALAELATEACLSGAEFLYADDRRRDPQQPRSRRFAKPGWSPSLLLGFNYIGRGWIAARTLVARSALDCATIAADGCHDSVLRLTEAAARIATVPRFLADLSGPDEPPAQTRAALVRAAARRGWAATIADGPVPGSFRLHPAPPDVLVSVIIATAGARDLVRQAVRAVRDTGCGTRHELIILDGTPPEATALRAWLTAEADLVIPAPHPFNWSHANNLGAAAAHGAFLLFLNDDIEAIDTGWLPALLARAAIDGVGAVGAQLLYPDRTIQHAGMFLHAGGALHAHRGLAGDAPGPFGQIQLAHEVAAVTGACLMTRRDLFERLGGFDLAHDITMNDVDYCLRVGEAGWRVVYDPAARLIHHEMASRAALPDSHDAAGFAHRFRLRLAQGDPLLRPAFPVGDTMQPDSEPVEWLYPGSKRRLRDEIRTILIIKLDQVADMVHAVPALQRLRAAFRGARIVLLGAPEPAELARRAGLIDAVIPHRFFVADGARAIRPLTPELHAALAAEIRAVGADLAIDLGLAVETRPLLRLSQARLLAGFDQDGRFPWLDIAQPVAPDRPMMPKHTHRSTVLLQLAAITEAATAPAPDAVAPRPHISAPRHAYLYPGSGQPFTAWPEAHHLALLRLLHEIPDLELTVLGDGAVGQRLLSGLGHGPRLHSARLGPDCAGWPELLRGAALFVGEDGAVTQLAAALGVPTVSLHAARHDATETGPAGPAAIALRRRMRCGPCYLATEAACPRQLACLRTIEPAAAYRACRFLLGLSGGGAS